MKRATVQKQKKLLSGVFSRCTAFRNSYVAAKGHRTLCRLWYRTGDCHQCGKKRWLQKLLKFLAYPFKPSLASVYVTRKFKTTKLRNNDDRNIRRLVDAVLDRCSTTLMYDRSSEFREIDDFSADTRAFLRDIGKNQAWTDWMNKRDKGRRSFRFPG